METRVDILLSIYKPNIEWFIEQLISLNNQTYTNLHMIVLNDCPDDEVDYQKVIIKYIKNFEFEYYNERINLGAAKAFEKLTKISTAKLIAYCDQDDIWLPNKISDLVNYLEQTDADMVCCDMYVIDDFGKVIANSITELRPKQDFRCGEDLLKYIITKNYVYGCACVVKKEVAIRSFPIMEPFYHDWWIAIYVVVYGKLVSLQQPLINYRIHNCNQTGFLVGIDSKEDYYTKKILDFKRKIDAIRNIYGDSKLGVYLKYYNEYSNCRCDYFFRPRFSEFIKLLSFRKENTKTVIFELLLPFMPDFIFKFILAQIRKGNI